MEREMLFLPLTNVQQFEELSTILDARVLTDHN